MGLKILAKRLVRLPSTVGRTTHSKNNLRLFPKTSRETDKWKAIYKRRSSIERSNKREKIDYHLEAGKHRSTMMWYVRIFAIMICQHMDAWYVHQEKELKFLKTKFFAGSITVRIFKN